ncbi:MAG: Sapep family Mn(2+)-dependent dipeptidase [Eggerthellaceae bacterium]|nr:Sapep family Mn(2+)-dependent dipeptidase [Eggerthellaceae bacterium]
MNDELQREIDAYIEAHWEEVIADINTLVRVDSIEDLDAAADGAPYGPEPREALDRALGIAARMGLDSHDCGGHVGYADLPGESATQIGIIGHVDVVPAGPGWHFPAHEVTRKDGYLIGRGVLDDKGPLMVALHAVKFWKDRGATLPYTVRVLFGANEETNMKDVAYYREHFEDPAFLFTPDSQFPVGYGEAGICSGTLKSGVFYGASIIEFEGGQAVNAVPAQASAIVRQGAYPFDDDDYDCISVEEYRGDIAKIEATGKSAHAAEPELGVNAIGLLVDYLLENEAGSAAERAFLELLQKLHGSTDGSGLGIACSDEHFGSLTAVGGKAYIEKVSMNQCRICQTIDFRYPTTITSAEIEHRVNDLAVEAGATFTMEHDKTPFLMDPESPAVQVLLDAYNEVTGENRGGMTSKGGTYARMFTTGVSFGVEKPWEDDPDWVGTMHGPDEGVSEELLKQAFSIYARALGKLMNVELR